MRATSQSIEFVGEWEVEGWLLGSLDGIPLTLGPPDGLDDGAAQTRTPEGVEEGASLSVGDVEGFDIGRPLTEGLRLGMVEPAMLGLDDSMEALAFALVTSLLCDLATSPKQ
ncbi:hypothetical protein THAOC_24114 [Thalassiosira oceanica]|uniref:Uncharacterized protein n=1 Tax=Thalassiosira oceanica TaxID=159749 RepID=K0RSS8_THAOC|nr:hypothetical protein THAOC_24114 [Thalassiosira oceanica]|eukprot:EJK56065.1 hypothetical protein THAOC_24114 [Thalassiosira oceanica]